MREIPWTDIPREKIMGALRRVLVSDEFKSSPQLAAFLTFSVTRTIEGRGALLKAYTVATEVLGRHADFDPQTDPIVRVEATRLRRALDRYYLAEGRDEPIRITMPRGGYAIVIQGLDEDPARPEPTRHQTSRLAIIGKAQKFWKQSRNAVTMLAFLGFIASSILLIFDERPSATDSASDARPRYGALIAGTISGIPTVEGFGLADLIVETSAHFNGIMVFSGMVPHPPDDLYVVEGSAVSEASLYRIDLRLRHAASGRVIWAHHLRIRADTDTVRLAARRLAHRLVGHNGAIRTDALPVNLTQNTGTLSPRGCLALADLALRSQAASLNESARHCLDDAIAQRGTSAPLLVASALLRLKATPTDQDIIEREARMAIALQPNNAEAANILAEIEFKRGHNTARSWGEQAVAANPYDPAILRAQANRLVSFGNSIEAAQLTSQALTLELPTDTD